MRATCVCGHVKAEHTITTGSNSIGRSRSQLCGHGAKMIGPYAYPACPCGGRYLGDRSGYKFSLAQTIRNTLAPRRV